MTGVFICMHWYHVTHSKVIYFEISAVALTEDDFIKKYYKNWYLQIDVQRSAKVIVVARNICTTIIVTKDAG